MNEARLQTSIKEALDGSTASALLSGAGMQARNFTTALEAPACGECPAFYRDTPLISEVEQLCDPAVLPDGATLLNLVLKYFHAYVHDGAHEQSVSYGEIATLLAGFSRHQSMNEPGDDPEIMNRMRNWSGALRCLADIPRAAFIAGKVLGAGVKAGPEETCPHLAVDVGAASGLLVLASYVQAHRNRFTRSVPCGFMVDPLAGERTADLLRSLDAGSIIPADPSRPGAYASIYGLKVHFVANESMALLQGGIGRENCFARYGALFRAAGKGLDEAVFLPEGVVAHCSGENMSALLTPDNHFQPPAGYEYASFSPQGLLLDGEILPAHRLGKDLLG